ncbi:hypothetical protein M422DRAFT_36090 [Sphaerobolus stellatus SS14]|uniref:Uncharacterized protein n=1 Tax=Sphaerobolus stellatus (strain SS14) TaxID=990650 RepID=A0A0C9V2S9_SPHS4|nr:hypothetical protein M422DRAFT_36090 [Sphaerobolus stellatus SS14]
MGQDFGITNLDGQFANGGAKYGESYGDPAEWLIRLLANPNQLVTESSRIPSLGLPPGSWRNDRLICLGDGTRDLPMGCLQDIEIKSLRDMGLGNDEIYYSLRDHFESAHERMREDDVLKPGRPWVMANLSKREYFSLDAIKSLRGELISTHGAKKFKNINAGSVLISRICWSSDPGASMRYRGFRYESGKVTELNRGSWAGDRFAILALDDEELSAFTNITTEVCMETRVMWLSERFYYPDDLEGFGFMIWAEDYSNVYMQTPQDSDDYEDILPLSKVHTSVSGIPWKRTNRKGRKIVKQKNTVNPTAATLPQELLENIFYLVFESISTGSDDEKSSSAYYYVGDDMDRPVDKDECDESSSEEESEVETANVNSLDIYPQLDRLLNLRLVCRTWSQTLVNAPNLRIRISAQDPLDHAKIYIKSLQTKSLHVEIFGPRTLGLWSVIESEVERWQGLTLGRFLNDIETPEESRRHWDELFKILEKSDIVFPRVTNLQIYAKGSFSRHQLNTLLNRCPKLEVLQIHLLEDFAEQVIKPGVLSHLRDIKLYDPSDSLVAHLVSILPPELTTITLLHSKHRGSFTSRLFAPLKKKPLTHVHVLRLIGDTPGNILTIEGLIASLPNIDTLEIDKGGDGQRIIFCQLSHDGLPLRESDYESDYRCLCHYCWDGRRGISREEYDEHEEWEQQRRKRTHSMPVVWPQLHTLRINGVKLADVARLLQRRRQLEVPFRYLSVGGSLGGVGMIGRLRWWKEKFSLEHVDRWLQF